MAGSRGPRDNLPLPRRNACSRSWKNGTDESAVIVIFGRTLASAMSLMDECELFEDYEGRLSCKGSRGDDEEDDVMGVEERVGHPKEEGRGQGEEQSRTGGDGL